MRSHRRRVYSCLAGIALAVAVVTHSRAAANDPSGRDLTPLVEFIVPAYTAMYYAGVCVLVDRGYLQPVGPQGTIVQYAEHIKDEIATLLPEDEARLVFEQANDLARTVANEHLVKFGRGRSIVDGEEIAAWCASYVIKFVREFVQHHDSDHASNHVSLFQQFREVPEAPR